MNPRNDHPNDGWRSFIVRVSALVIFMAVKPVMADVTFNWTPLEGSVTMDAPLAGRIVITDAAYQAGSFNVAWRDPYYCGLINCSADPNGPVKEFYFWYFSPRSAIDQFPTVSDPRSVFNWLDMNVSIIQGRLMGHIMAGTFQTDVRMDAATDTNWTIQRFASDNSESGCGWSKSCSGASGYWMDASVPSPATLALVISGGLLMRRRKSAV